MSTIPGSDPPSDVLGALATLARYCASLVRDAAAGHAANDTSERYYDARTSPMGRRAFLRLAREKAFPTFKAGKRLVARRVDVHAWIEAQKGARPPGPRPRPRPEAPPPQPQEITPDMIHAEIMKGGGARPRGGRGERPPNTRRSGPR
jgi:hypothetical protein